ncbi:hypothetical protein BDN70DRAFT_803339 [Pholiota conissans]|uniref:F-box domain-containing protein n=1 Tax=Pholiota conissans TaxID=109636 RepID=A0A9P5Z7F4_9AGAR|nr:hypothetical protein BDN70DRAFT_803339 [Pholiota conissans]
MKLRPVNGLKRWLTLALYLNHIATIHLCCTLEFSVNNHEVVRPPTFCILKAQGASSLLVTRQAWNTLELRSKKRVPYRSTKIPANSSTFCNTSAVQSFGREQGKALKTRKRTRHNEIEPGDGRPAKRSHLYPHEGPLNNLVEAPVDVLFEIFGLLEPRDLLHIARTTKSLRSLLMSRSSVTVWKSARSNIFGLPDCPDDLSEPQYAALMFVKRCTVSFSQLNSSIFGKLMRLLHAALPQSNLECLC